MTGSFDTKQAGATSGNPADIPLGDNASSEGLYSENRSLLRRSWQNWVLLAAVCVVTTIGLATAIPPLLENRFPMWPWPKTDLVLLVGLSITMLAFVGHMTHQQRRMLSMGERMQRLQRESERKAKRHYTQVLGLFNVSRIISAPKVSLEMIFDCVTKMCLESFNCQRSTLMLLEEDGKDLVVLSSAAYLDESDDPGSRRKTGEGIAGWVVEHRKPVLLQRRGDLANYPGLEVHQAPPATMVVPIHAWDELVGVLTVEADSGEVEFDEEDLRVLWVFAENAGVCIRQAKQTQRLRNTIEGLETNTNGVEAVVSDAL